MRGASGEALCRQRREHVCCGPMSHAGAEQRGAVAPVSGASRALGFGVAFGLVGVLEAALVLVAGDGARDGGVPTTLLAIAALWVLLGGLTGCLAHVALRLALGARARAGCWELALLGWRSLWQARGSAVDRRRLGVAAGALVAVGALGVGSYALLRWLIENRNGAALIAAAFLGGQTLLVVGAVFGGVVTGRAVAATRRVRWLSTPLVLAGAAAALVAVAIAGVITNRGVLRQVDGDAVALVGLALAASGAGVRWVRGRGLRWRTVPAAAAVTFGVLLAATQVQATRRAVGMEAMTARHLFGWLVRQSDFDRDTVPFFPTGADCAPFDARVHPLADDLAGNGIDEDCDGRDEAPAAPFRRPAAPPPVRLAEPRPSLVLITVDSLRADHLGLYGYPRDTSPRLDARAAQAVVFERAWAADSGTGPSLWSLMAGKTPFQVALTRAHRFPPRFADSERLLAEQLRAAGYRTEALLCGKVFGTKGWNLNRGFDSYRVLCAGRHQLQAEGVARAAVPRLKALGRGRRPFFLWVHFFDPHTPYFDHPDQDLGKGEMDRYDEEIRYTDRYLDEVLAAVPPGAFVAISADHGENFDEHGRLPHARTLYREVTHVPLLVFGPGVQARRVSTPVALNDLYPTFLDLAGLPVPDGCTMVSQATTLFGAEPDPRRPIFQENAFARPKRHVKAVVRGHHHLLWDVTLDARELYDLSVDPGETHNLYGSGVPEEAELEALLRGFVRTTHVPEALAR